jgi:hypothetical protein
VLSPADRFSGRDHDQLQAIRHSGKGLEGVAACQISAEVEEVDNKKH